MSSIFIVIMATVFFLWGYKFYAVKLEHLWGIDKKRPTPADSKFDGVDFVPAKNWLVLFGHHFSSIAGAGPIIGPVIACIVWGWIPALIWIVIGTVFIGAVHDFGSLMCSVRQGGSSVADIAQIAISHKAKIIFLIFVWLALILVIAVFAYLCADTFVKEPKVALPSLGLIPVALLVGFLLYRRKVGNILSTLIGLVLLGGLIFLAGSVNIPAAGFNFWVIALLVYCFFASVIPVNILLQPRDYLSSFLLFAGVFFGYAGLFISRPMINQPAFVGFNVSYGSMWPVMFVTVACGAISGFHSLIASGTSSKQLPNEIFARRIGYGGMVTEGVVALLAVIAVCAGLKGVDLNVLLRDVGPVNSFSKGYGALTKNILGGHGGFIAIIILNAFILTTLDTATRISRYLTEELLGIKNRYIATIVVIAAALGLALTGAWSKIWPVFGASNQLVAALALFVITCWLLSHGKTIKFTLMPAIFMFVTTVAALLLQAKKYLLSADYVLLAVIVSLLALAFYLLIEVVNVLYFKRGKNNA